MIIESLSLRNFRNYEELDLRFSPRINVFHGLNGQGKTNLLEAIYLCTCARSHRTAQDADLIRFGAGSYEVELHFEGRRAYQESLRLVYTQENSKSRKRSIFHDGIQLPRIAEMMGIFHAVIFAPEDLQLLREGPARRRRFLDLLLSQLDPRYFAALQKYVHLLQQRNRMLKLQEEDAKWKAMLEVWDWQLAEAGTYILRQRNEAAAHISELATEQYRLISSDREPFSLRYHTSLQKDLDLPAEELQAHYFERLQESCYDDRLRGSTSLGPHRDDIYFYLNERPAKAFASQGQTRSMVLALKLAELAWIARQTGENPVLLLDDVLSELDVQRRNALLRCIAGVQVFVTCTEKEQAEQFWTKEFAAKGGNPTDDVTPTEGGSSGSGETPAEVALTYYHVEGGRLLTESD